MIKWPSRLNQGQRKTLSDWSGFIGPKLAGLEANNFEKVTLMLVTDVGDDSW